MFTHQTNSDWCTPLPQTLIPAIHPRTICCTSVYEWQNSVEHDRHSLEGGIAIPDSSQRVATKAKFLLRSIHMPRRSRLDMQAACTRAVAICKWVLQTRGSRSQSRRQGHARLIAMQRSTKLINWVEVIWRSHGQILGVCGARYAGHPRHGRERLW